MSAEDVPLNGLVKLSEGRSSGNVQGAHVGGSEFEASKNKKERDYLLCRYGHREEC